MVVVSVVWLVGAVLVSRQIAERSENDAASVFHQIYELLSWWAALQMLMLSVALVALAQRLHRGERESANDAPPSD
jgi:hypothetical protein